MRIPHRPMGREWHEAQGKRAGLRYSHMERLDSLFLTIWMPVQDEPILTLALFKRAVAKLRDTSPGPDYYTGPIEFRL